MKAFKINSKAALAVITTALSLTLSPSAKPKKRVKIIKQLQLLMFLNNKKYNVHVLESDSFVYRGIAHIKSIEVEGDVQFIEELEVEVKEESHEVSQHFSAFVKEILKTKGGLRQGETAQELLNRVLVENRRGSSDSDKPESSKSPCDCQACTSIRKMKKANKLQKKK
jgi:hypothetical protein